jgi:FkbM family methyltransferase
MSQLAGSLQPPGTSDELLTLVDVGGAGGIDSKWQPFLRQLRPVLFEPNHEQAVLLRQSLTAQYDNAIVIESALAHITADQDLNIAAYWGCTSIREPNQQFLSNYRIAPAFNIVRSDRIMCRRYDHLYFNGDVPVPDAVKIDVQGFEYEVLQGFGGLLENCLSIELETHIYPIYKNQKLMHDLVAFLADFGFVVRRMNAVPNFDGDVVELDVWFTKNIGAWRRMTDIQKKKFKLICDACELIDYRRIDPSAPHSQINPA